jgi:hypothetical protein
MIPINRLLLAPLLGLCLANTPAADAKPAPEHAAWQRAGKQLMADIHSALAAGRRTIVIPPGDYMFASTRHEFALRDLTDVRLEGKGATFWFPRTNGRVRLENCRRVTLSGVTLDQTERPFIQGRIREIDPIRNTVIADAEPGYPARADLKDPDEPLRCIFFPPDGSRELDVRDGNGRLLPESTAETLVIQMDNIFKETRARPVRPDDRLTLALRGGGGGLRLANCGECVMENITIHSSAGFAITETNRSPGGNLYRDCRIIRHPKRNDLLAGAADGFHSMMQMRGPILENCELAWTADDLVNIHGFFQMVIEQRSPSELVIAGPDIRNFEQGSALSFFRPPNASPLGEARVKDWRPLDDAALLERVRGIPARFETERNIRVRSFDEPEPCLVTLDRPLELQPCDLVQCGDYAGAGAVVRNCHLHDGHVRGLLVKSDGARLLGNRIERVARAGIVVKPEWYWLEGPFAQAMRIESNRLADCAWQSFTPQGFYHECAPIVIQPDFSRRMFPAFYTPERLLGEIHLLGNTVINSPGPAVIAGNARKTVIAGNLFQGVYRKTSALPGLDFSTMIDHRNPPPQWRGAMPLLKQPDAAVMLNSLGMLEARGNLLQNEPRRPLFGFGLWCDTAPPGTVWTGNEAAARISESKSN